MVCLPYVPRLHSLRALSLGLRASLSEAVMALLVSRDCEHFFVSLAALRESDISQQDFHSLEDRLTLTRFDETLTVSSRQ